MTKERPILFSGDMVRALLAGTKTQTRRALKPKMPLVDLIHADGEDKGRVWYGAKQVPLVDVGDAYPFRCRFGLPGDRLWVRETWSRMGCKTNCGHLGCYTIFKASEARSIGAYGAVRWTPSIHMPRWASRLTLDVTNVRVERLQDINDADAIAEGIERTVTGDGWRRYADPASELAGVPPCATAKQSYRSLWEQINGDESWTANPWVWVVEFKRIET